eukprot:2912875-Rhodomonas_salina.1
MFNGTAVQSHHSPHNPAPPTTCHLPLLHARTQGGRRGARVGQAEGRESLGSLIHLSINIEHVPFNDCASIYAPGPGRWSTLQKERVLAHLWRLYRSDRCAHGWGAMERREAKGLLKLCNTACISYKMRPVLIELNLRSITCKMWTIAYCHVMST